MTYDETLAELLSRGYGPRYACHLLHQASTGIMRVVDELPRREDGTRPGVQICALNNAGTRFSIRNVTITRTT